MKGDSKSTNARGPSLVGSLGLSGQYWRFLSGLSGSSRPSTKYFFPRRTLFLFICPDCPASWAGGRARSPVSKYASLDLPDQSSLVVPFAHMVNRFMITFYSVTTGETIIYCTSRFVRRRRHFSLIINFVKSMIVLK